MTGLALLSFKLETIALTLFAVYNIRMGFSFSLYGDLIFGMLQCYILLSMFWYFDRSSMLAVFTDLLSYATILLLLFFIPSGFVPLITLTGMVISWTSVIPQIMSNQTNRSTGNLSLETQAMTTVGILLRFFTLLVETDDKLSLFGTLMAIIFHGTILLQILLFNNYIPTPLVFDSVGFEFSMRTGPAASIGTQAKLLGVAFQLAVEPVVNLVRQNQFLQKLDSIEFKDFVDSLTQ